MPVPPVPLLFLIADTGGGHRSAARAVGQALERTHPGQFEPVLCDPLGGAGTPWLLRRVTSLYGPVTRRAPWLWGAAYHLVDSAPGMRALHRLLLSQADGPAIDAARALQPAAVVSFHPLACLAAGAVRDHLPAAAVTVITDLTGPHAAWLTGHPDLIVTPASILRAYRPSPGQDAARPSSPDTTQTVNEPARSQQAAAGRLWPARLWWAGIARSGAGWGNARAPWGPADEVPTGPLTAAAGPPARREFWSGPVSGPERLMLRRSLGLTPAGDDGTRMLIVLAGGAEGCGGLARQAATILRSLDRVTVVAVCGHNQRLRRRLDRLKARQPDPAALIVTGFCEQLADLMRCADLVVTKAGPGTITEAACCGTPLLLTSHLPGQERDNAAIVLRAGAGRLARGRRRLRTELARLTADPPQLDRMRAAAARLSRPGDATRIAHLIAEAATRSAPDGNLGAGLAQDHAASNHTGQDNAGPESAERRAGLDADQLAGAHSHGDGCGLALTVGARVAAR